VLAGQIIRIYPGTPCFGIITIPTSVYRHGDGDDRSSGVPVLDESGEAYYLDPSGDRLADSFRPNSSSIWPEKNPSIPSAEKTPYLT
jgi:hypothetical protein